jgi:hypothetical protein
VFELGAGIEEVDGDDVEADAEEFALGFGVVAEEGPGDAAEDALLGGADLGAGGKEVAAGAGFDLEDDEGCVLPGDEVEVSGAARGAPAAGGDVPAVLAEEEEGGIFAALAGEEMRGLGALAGTGGATGEEVVGPAAEAGV